MRVLWICLLGACKGPDAPLDTDTSLPIGGELLGVGVAPRDPRAALGERVPFFATAYYENTTYEDITPEVLWTSTDTRVATIGADGVATALAEGETTIIASAPGGSTNQVRLTVLGDSVQATGMVVQPATVSLNMGQTVQLTPVATYSDGSSGTVGAACTWTSQNPSVAIVSPSGLVGGQGEGSTAVSASCGGAQSSAGVTVAAAGVDLGAPNLSVAAFDAFALGDEVFWLVDVVNQGPVAASGFFVDLVLDAGAAPPPGTWDATRYVAGLAPGETALLTLSLEAVAAGAYQSWVRVDPEDYVVESNEGDNVSGPRAVQVVATATGPDLVVSAEGLTDGVDTLYLVEVRNDGDAPALDFWIDLWTDAILQPEACTYGDHYVHVASLAPGATFVWEPLLAGQAPSLFYWDSWVWADACDDLGDAYPADNLVHLLVDVDL